MAWRVAKALAVLRDEIDAAAPKRGKASDGYVGDERHQRTKSDHVPCDCHEVVCAADWTHHPKGDFDANTFAEWLRQRVADGLEKRVKYVIWARRIFSGPDQGKTLAVWRPYSGSNPHTKHIHLSVRHGAEHYDNDAPWGWPPEEEETSL